MRSRSISILFAVFGSLILASSLCARSPSPAKLESQPSLDNPENTSSHTKSEESVLYQLKEFSLDSSVPTSVSIRISATGGLLHASEEKLVRPGRLLLEIPHIENGMTVNSPALTDHVILPRVRFAQHADRLRIILDTVLDQLPPYTLHKTDQQIDIVFTKTPEIIAEAKARTELFAALQSDDRDALLKLSSVEEGGVLFSDSSSAPITLKTNGGNVPSAGVRTSGGSGMRLKSNAGRSNTIVLIPDGREFKIFVQDTQAPIHIQKVRPVYEVKGIQSRLKNLGYDAGVEDGSLGTQTRDALRKFQQDNHLPDTGSPTKVTQRELKKQFGY